MLLTPFLWIFVNLIKKSLTICLWQNREVDFDFLRCKACALRHRRAAGADELR